MKNCTGGIFLLFVKTMLMNISHEMWYHKDDMVS